jgi:hypothetical protein
VSAEKLGTLFALILVEAIVEVGNGERDLVSIVIVYGDETIGDGESFVRREVIPTFGFFAKDICVACG